MCDIYQKYMPCSFFCECGKNTLLGSAVAHRERAKYLSDYKLLISDRKRTFAISKR